MKKLKVGQLFTIPVADDRVGHGQIAWAGGHGTYMFAVFAGLFEAGEDLEAEEIVAGQLVLFARSLDALLYHDHWRVIGEHPVQVEELPWPAYKVADAPGQFLVIDHTAERRREATEFEAEQLPFETTVAPIRIEKALSAWHGYGTWEDTFDELRPVPPDRTAMALFEG